MRIFKVETPIDFVVFFVESATGDENADLHTFMTYHKKPGRVPLERAFSKLGHASRGQARELILAGRVKVNGTIRKDPLFAVTPETAILEVDGKRLDRQEWRAVLLHKPKSVVTTRADEKGRATVFSLLKDGGSGLHAVGRLDFATTGLLILTNDTRLSSWLTDPENAVPRTYVVTVRGEITPEKLSTLQKGVVDEGELLKPDAVELKKASGRESHLIVTLSEGKNREIRRLFLSLGNEVTRLKRIAYGGLELGDLAPGAYREIDREELERLFPEAFKMSLKS
jgi:23S rRNA pseudouridine2605 synthase